MSEALQQTIDKHLAVTKGDRRSRRLTAEVSL